MKDSFIQFFRLHKTLFLTLTIWLGLVMGFFAPSVFNDKVIAPIDCMECVFRPFAEKSIEEVHNQFAVDGVSQYLPYKWAVKQSFAQDGYMGWNPYSFNGTACPENTMTSPGDLFNWLYAVLPFWTAWDWSIVLQFFIAGCGMIVLTRYYKMPIWGALLAAISFAFYSQFILWIYHRWMEAMIWSPFLVWAMLKYKRNLINVPAIIFMALIWRTGHLQACTFGFMLVACLWGAAVWKKNGHWPTVKEFSRITLSCLFIGSIAALLSLDVFVDTLPRMEGCKRMPFYGGYQNIPMFIASLFPNVVGIPETIDVGKYIGSNLFEIKFGGSVVLILALMGCFNRNAPREAKVIFVVSLLAVCTPLATYIYSRSTVVMALGMAWLAAWQLCDLSKVQFSARYWKRLGYALVGACILWLVASVVIICCHAELLNKLTEMLYANMTHVHHYARAAWMEVRVEKLLSQVLLWDWQNLLLVIGLLAGIFCCCKIKIGNRYNALLASCVAAITYMEMLVFSYSYMSYAEQPEGPHLFNSPVWMSEVKAKVKEGTVYSSVPGGDRDFLCNNQLSSYGIRLAYGYETFQPKHIKPLEQGQFNPEDFAQAGISHIMSDTKWKKMQYPGWQLVMSGKDFDLFANPAYKGRYLVDEQTVITPTHRTCNRIYLTIPSHSETLTVLESYHKGWKAFMGDKELTIAPTERGGMFIHLPQSDKPISLKMQFRMPYREWYYTIMALTALFLIIVVIRQRKANYLSV